MDRYLAWAAVLCFWYGAAANAWGWQGHQIIAQLAEKGIASTPAAAQVSAILEPGERLSHAAIWPDCLKSLPRSSPVQEDVHRERAQTPRVAHACAFYFNQPAALQEMRAFNTRHAGKHNSRPFHYTNPPFQHGRYRANAVGTFDRDIVVALQAAIAVLRGEPNDTAVQFDNRREALRWLIHLVGDIHQPWHVGAVYVDAHTNVRVPSTLAEAAAWSTKGGNRLKLGSTNMHSIWDTTLVKAVIHRGGSAAFVKQHFAKAHALTVQLARTAPAQLKAWPVAWATDAIVVGTPMFKALVPQATEHGGWSVALSKEQRALAKRLVEQQLVKGGARLAGLLQAIWPEKVAARSMALYYSENE